MSIKNRLVPVFQIRDQFIHLSGWQGREMSKGMALLFCQAGRLCLRII